MAILFVSHKYPPATGGMEKQCYELVEGMRKYAQVYTLILAEGQSRLHFFWNLERSILEQIRLHPDISVVHFNDALIGAVAARHTGYRHLKRMVTVHGLDVVFPNRTYQQRIFPRFAEYDQLIAVSKATAQACIDRGIPVQRVTVVPNGVDHAIATMPHGLPLSTLAQQYGFDTQTPYFVAMGRSVKRKGFSWFASEVLPHLNMDAQLIIIGPFEQEPGILERLLGLFPKAFAHQIALLLGFPSDQAALRPLLRNQPRLHHLGRLPFDHLVAILRGAHGFVMPNISVPGDMEGFGLVCLEAALAPVPVFASGIEGITEAILNDENGILLPAEQPEAWQSSLNHCLEYPDLYRQKAVDFQRFTLENYSWDLMVRRYAAVFGIGVR